VKSIKLPAGISLSTRSSAAQCDIFFGECLCDPVFERVDVRLRATQRAESGLKLRSLDLQKPFRRRDYLKQLVLVPRELLLELRA
jgi:hypothetical protein